MRIHAVVAYLAGTAGWVVGLSALEWAYLLVAISIVLIAETANTALEWLVDLASPEYHDLARRAKDAAAGAVLMSAVGSAVGGLVLFGSRLETWPSAAERAAHVSVAVWGVWLVVLGLLASNALRRGDLRKQRKRGQR